MKKKATKEELDANESRNIRVIGKFKNYWSTASFNIQSQSGPLYFNAQISYQSPRQSVIGEKADVRIQLSGYGSDGQLDIFESTRLNVDDFHLQVLAKWGKYTLETATGELVYQNNSTKMGGDYTIRILPISTPLNPFFH